MSSLILVNIEELSNHILSLKSSIKCPSLQYILKASKNNVLHYSFRGQNIFFILSPECNKECDSLLN